MKRQALSRTRLIFIFVSLALLLEPFSGFATTLYVRLDSPNPTPPYVSWATAATNIQHAVDAAQNGDTVLVSNGVYAVGIKLNGTASRNRVFINKAIAVRSVNGPAQTLIVGEMDANSTGAVRCVYLEGNALLDGFTLTNGHAGSGLGPFDARGGGAWCTATATLTNCVLTGNHAANDGGGVYGGTLNRCIITNNVADDGGGADHSTLYNCIITENRGRKGGGVDDSALYGCVLTRNRGRVFGGGAARSILIHCTVTDNYGRHGGGVSQCEVYNSIVYHNRAAVGPNHGAQRILSDNQQSRFDFSCTTPLPGTGSNNIAIDPKLASWSHLSGESPCLGAGSPLFSGGLKDIDGQVFGTPPSMGADEHTLGGPMLLPRPAIETDYTNVAVGYPVRFKVHAEGRMGRTRWMFGINGPQATNELITIHAFDTPGVHAVELASFAELLGSSVTTTVLIHVVSVPTAYVNVANSTPVFPYSSWATAATNIQDAIAVTNVAGRVVVVTNGVYDVGARAVFGSMSNRVALTNGVIVRSVNGPEFTVIRGAPDRVTGTNGNGAIRCAYVGDGSVLDGFTLTNGYTRAAGHVSREQGGGGVWAAHRGVLTNCIIVGNTAAFDGGGANGGILFRCTLVENRAYNHGGGVDDAMLFDCVVSNNIAGAHGGVSESVLYRTAVVGNRVFHFSGAGGVGESTLRNCEVRDNWADYNGGGAWRSALFNTVLRGNHGDGSAASDSDLLHCTIVGNIGLGGDGTVLEACRVRNSIVYSNSLNSNYLANANGSSISYSIMDPLPPGAGNIVGPPVFVDFADANLRLRRGSPGIDQAADLTSLTSIDLEGNPRGLDGDMQGGGQPDMGAYEFNGLYFTSISKVGGNVRLCWLDAVVAPQLESSPSLNAPAWNILPSSETNCVDLPANTNSLFLRLRVPAATEVKETLAD